MGLAFQFLYDIVGGHDLGLHAVYVQTAGVVACIGLDALRKHATLHIVLVSVKRPPDRRDVMISAHNLLSFY